MATRYRVREVNTVTDDAIEKTINEMASEGWAFESIQFAMRDASKRPSMAFILFTREEPDSEEPESNEESEGPGKY